MEEEEWVSEVDGHVEKLAANLRAQREKVTAIIKENEGGGKTYSSPKY